MDREDVFRGRVERAVASFIKDVNSDLGLSETRTRTCLGCGEGVVSQGRGRPRLWCDECISGGLNKPPPGADKGYQRAYYHMRMQDPAYAEKKRENARAYYRRMTKERGSV